MNHGMQRMWIAHRKHLKTAISQTAINLIANEAEKAGITLTDALAESIARGWRGFKAEWVQDKPAANQPRCNVTQHDRNASFMSALLSPLKKREIDVTPNVGLLGAA